MKIKNILLVSHIHFPHNSAVHVHYFANGLVKLGLDCVVAVPESENQASTIGSNLYKVLQFNEVDCLVDLFDNHQGPDIVHAWTPRENVRKFCMRLEERFRFKLTIHLEDNEERILEAFLGKSIEELTQANFNLTPPGLSHPKKHRDFLKSADGVTIIMDRLKEFVPDGVLTSILWPGADTQQFFPRPASADLAEKIGIPYGSTVVCYTGNSHPANVDEVRSLYRAVGNRNLHNKPTVLIRTGNYSDILRSDEAWIQQYTIEIGFVERASIPDLLALADVLIQPGQADPFNDYRFPSKIPEFLAMGKPVILPATNIGRFLTHLENAIILPVVDEMSLSDAIDRVVENPTLAQTLSKGAVQFVKSHLDWDQKSQDLKTFYETLSAETDETISLEKAFGRMQRQAQDLRGELQIAHTQLHATHAELQIAQTQLHATHAELQIAQTQLHTTHAELQIAQTQLHTTHAELQIAQTQLYDTHAELETAKATIAAMQSSKFWKLRKAWLSLKGRFGL